jgi:ribosomal-protein-alanine N-acetyltransferase
VSALLDLFRPGHRLRLEGPRIYLRPPRATDYRAWTQLRTQSRAFLTPWEPTWPETDLDRAAFRARLEAYARDLHTGEAWPFFILRKADDALVGAIRLFNVRRGVAESGVIGYWIGQPHARQGYMAEAVAAVIAFAFEDLRLHRLEAACMPENVGSARLLLKSGFREEGYAPAYLKINGDWRDHRLFGMTAPG